MTDTRPSPRRRVSLCADDFGLTPGADSAILELGAAGAISATSVAVDGDRATIDAPALRGLRDRISVGLHLNLTENPRFPQLRGVKAWILATWLHRIDRGMLEREIHQQFDHFETLLGGAPTHVDGHEHVHQFPGVREPLLDAVAKRYGPATVIRCTGPRHFRGPKATVIGLLGASALRRGLDARGLRGNSDFAGVYDLQATSGFESRMADWLGSIEDGGLIMCHPEAPEGMASAARRHEHDFLRSAAWPALREACKVDLTRPDQI